MPDPTNDLQLLATLCNKAVAECGENISEVERHVAAAIDALPGERRAALKAAIGGFLKVQSDLLADDAPGGKH